MEFYSLVLSLGTLGMLVATLVHMIGYAVSPALRQWTSKLDYDDYLRIIGALVISSVVFALGYQFIYNLAVCELCWWQRIWLFPIAIIVPVSLYWHIRYNHVLIAIMSALGLFFAGYHYYYHFQAWVLGNFLEMPCETGGLLTACIDNAGVLNFGFVTIPFMGVVLFVTLIWLSYLAHRKA
jgi:disulfide bond formation protein DsbB